MRLRDRGKRPNPVGENHVPVAWLNAADTGKAELGSIAIRGNEEERVISESDTHRFAEVFSSSGTDKHGPNGDAGGPKDSEHSQSIKDL